MMTNDRLQWLINSSRNLIFLDSAPLRSFSFRLFFVAFQNYYRRKVYQLVNLNWLWMIQTLWMVLQSSVWVFKSCQKKVRGGVCTSRQLHLLFFGILSRLFALVWVSSPLRSVFSIPAHPLQPNETKIDIADFLVPPQVDPAALETQRLNMIA